MERFDAIVIGAGQAGPALAVRCGAQGLKTCLIERGHFGGTCVNNGCIPTKTLLASARVAQIARRAAEYGVTVEGRVGVDMAAVKARKDRIVAASREGLGNWLEGAANLSLIRGQARFVAPRRLRVGERELEAERIFINAGGRPFVPDMPGLAQVPYFTNESMMEVDFLPEHLIVIGGSYIGLEFAQMYRRFGSRVTVCEMGSRLVGREDEDVSAEIRAILEREGIEVRVDAKCLSAQPRGERVAVGLACTEGAPEIEGSHLLLAVGRVPNTDGLGLEAAAIDADARGYIRVNDRLETSAAGVWALGDVNGRGAFTHTSWNDHEIVAANLFDGAARSVTQRIPAYALFIDPPLGRAGMSFAEAKATGRPVLAAKMPMSRVGRAREAGETQGFMKIAVDAGTRRILGFAILGLSGDEVVHSVLDTMYADASCDTLLRAMHIHPTVSELVPTLLGGLAPLE